MKESEAHDTWRRLSKKQYANGFESVDLGGLNNLNKIEFAKGMTVICGLNGVGKSTIISAVKDIVGLPLTIQDQRKLNGHTIGGAYALDGQSRSCSNQENQRLSDLLPSFSLEKAVYIDSAASAHAQSYIVSQTHFDELLEQFEEHKLDPSEIKALKYITGKEYETCTITEMEDIDGEGTLIPYFRVCYGGQEYDSAGMGSGEHFLLFLFWRINRMEKGTLLIIEEPESYISISSQIHFMNFLGKQMLTKECQVILTTHSPYILSNVQNHQVRIVSRVGKNVAITEPNELLFPENILGLSANRRGTIFVEDQVAYDFLSAILKDKAPHILKQYAIDVADGEAGISQRLRFPRSKNIHYDFIGVYDGDMRRELDNPKKRVEFQWKYCFLPGDKGMEDIFRDYLRDDVNLSSFCRHMKKSKDIMITFMSTISGQDGHDWFHGLRNALSITGYELVDAFYKCFLRDDNSVSTFLADLQKCIYE